MKSSVLTWKIGGQAGDGQQTAGLILSKLFSRKGLFIFDISDFPSLIRSGHVTYQVSVANQPVTAAYQQVDILLALNQETIDYHQAELADQALILYDQNLIKIPPRRKKQWQILGLPLSEMSRQTGGGNLARNIVGLGATLAAFGLDLTLAQKIIAEMFADKGPKIVQIDHQALQLGYDYAKKNLKTTFKLSPPKNLDSNRLVVTGNEAVALGAIAAGCKLHVHYPMSPSSSILHTLAAWASRSGMVVKQPEDEISAINTAIGGAYVGVRAMTATSGGGFALMTEGLALAAMTETPLVVVVSQRPGPATGLPTWSEQGDLNFVVHASHGEFPRIVLAPGDAEEAFYLTGQAFNLAEIYQLPVIILLDKYLSDSHQAFGEFDSKKITINRGQLLSQSQLNQIKNFKRYLLTKNGISPRSLPGQKGGVYLANSDEHDEKGFSIEGWQPEMRLAQVEKRWRKLPQILADKNLPPPKLYGPKTAALTLVGWGSVKGPVLEALKLLPQVNFLHFTAVYPLAVDKIKKGLAGTKKLIAIENNYQGQFADLLFQQTGIKVAQKITKYSGRQFYPEEIVSELKKISK